MAEKKIPTRMCIACRSEKPKKELIRIVKSSSGEISLDKTGKKAGRGAYICDSIDCVEKCIKTKALNRAFKEEISADVYGSLRGEYLDKQQN